MGAMDLKRHPIEVAGWIILGLLLLFTLIGAVRLDRSHHPLLGDEATYAMQAASLAWDFDLSYTRQDYDRFVAHWGVPPEGLVLQSRVGRPGSDRLVFAKPPLYAILLAPFVRLAPVRGPVVVNALLLAAAAVLAGLALRHRIGGAAPHWIAAFLFASVAFAHVFWGDADLFLLACTASGLALVYWEDRRYVKGEEPPPEIYQGEDLEPRRRSFARWCGAGALLAVAVVYRPVYLTLFLPAVIAAWKGPVVRRWTALTGLVLGGVALACLSLGIQWMAGGDPTGYGGQRQGIYGREGYPAVDFPASAWSEQVERQGNASWLEGQVLRPELNPKLAGWNLVYLFLGRNVGILPYFLPLLLGFVAFQRDRGRWALPVAVAVAVVAFLILRPFNFSGGGALGNRYFLPLYPALWFLAARPVRAVWAPVMVLLAAPFVGPLWNHPTAYPIGEDGQPSYLSPVARRWLPYETTQGSLPGEQVGVGGGLWVKLLNHNAWPAGRGSSLRIAGGAPVELLLGSPQPLDSVDFELDSRAPTRLLLNGEELRPLMLRSDGTEIFAVRLWSERAVHPVWWSRYDHHLYALSFRLPGARTEPIGLRILPPRDLIQPHRGD